MSEARRASLFALLIVCGIAGAIWVMLQQHSGLALFCIGMAGTEMLQHKQQRSVYGKKKMSRKIGTPLERYIALCYRLLGKRLQRWDFEHFDEHLKQARLNYSPQAYLAFTIITTVLATAGAFGLFFVLFVVVVNTSLLFPVVLTAVAAGAAAMFFVMIIQLRISSRKIEIDQELPFTLSELSILASTGLSPIQIIRQVVTRGADNAITEEFRRMLYKIEVEGKDIISAMSATAQETPSLLLRETLWDISNMIHQGGDLDRNLREKADQTLQLKRDVQKEFIEKLMMYSEGYMSLVVIGVLFAGIGAFLLSALGGSLRGLGANAILFLLTYLIIPLAIVITGVMLSMSYERSGYKT